MNPRGLLIPAILVMATPALADTAAHSCPSGCTGAGGRIAEPPTIVPSIENGRARASTDRRINSNGRSPEGGGVAQRPSPRRLRASILFRCTTLGRAHISGVAQAQAAALLSGSRISRSRRRVDDARSATHHARAQRF